jgi:hypothetical protein
MATGTDAEFQRMAAALIKDAHMGGSGATAALDKHMKVMAAVGRRAVRPPLTRSPPAQHRRGRRAADRRRYGVNLARGINPVLGALGGRTCAERARRVQHRRRVRRAGGYTGDGGKYEPEGHRARRRVRVHQGADPQGRGGRARGVGEDAGRLRHGRVRRPRRQVPRPPSTAPYRIPISTAGDSAMGKEYAETVAFVAAQAAARAAAAAASSRAPPPAAAGKPGDRAVSSPPPCTAGPGRSGMPCTGW